MYSPKIQEDLIPKLYQLKEKTGKPMTKIVDDLLRQEIEKLLRQLYLTEDAAKYKEATNAPLHNVRK